MLVGQERLDAFQSAEFFVLPSHQENFGISIAEAMALSLPVLITDKVNIWREVVEAKAGVCVSDTQDDVRNGLIQMCALTSDARALMAQNARRCFVEQFDLDKNARQFLALLDTLTQAPNDRAYDDTISCRNPWEASSALSASALVKRSAIRIGE
jgi:glycosyltransferase involved in cell wall biosynthesis